MTEITKPATMPEFEKAIDPREISNTYLASKKVLELFEDLSSKCLFSKPTDVNAFLLAELSKPKAPTFFSSKDVSTMFSMFDPTGRGTISRAQYKNALRSFGVESPKVVVQGEEVDRETFEAAIAQELQGL